MATTKTVFVTVGTTSFDQLIASISSNEGCTVCNNVLLIFYLEN